MTWRTLQLILAILAVPPLLSCDLVFSYRANPSPDEQVDVGQADADLDGPSDTLVTEDMAQPADGQGEDIPQDNSASDQTADTGTDSPGPDTAPAEPCVVPAVEVPWTNNMAICKLPTFQCDAAQYCDQSNGWHLCTASDYLANGGGAAGTPDGGAYWLAACIREPSSNPIAPTHTICSGGCSAAIFGVAVPVKWQCLSGTEELKTTWTPLGLITSQGCFRVGANEEASEGFWEPRVTSATAAGTVCCK